MQVQIKDKKRKNFKEILKFFFFNFLVFMQDIQASGEASFYAGFRIRIRIRIRMDPH